MAKLVISEKRNFSHPSENGRKKQKRRKIPLKKIRQHLSKCYQNINGPMNKILKIYMSWFESIAKYNLGHVFITKQ